MEKINYSIFELGSYALYGADDEVVFRYQHGSNFNHDAFNLILDMEMNMYQVYRNSNRSSKHPFKIELIDGVFTFYSNDELVYKVSGIHGLDFSGLRDTLYSYLDRYTFLPEASLVKLPNKRTMPFTEFKKSIRDEQAAFTECREAVPDRFNNPHNAPKDTRATEKKASKNSEVNNDESNNTALAELESLTGLDNIKEHVKKLYNHAIVDNARKEHGLPQLNMTYHSVFKGNPGTGKTTVARLLGSLFKDAGVLSSGHVIEVTRADLVGTYVGHTAPKTEKVIDSALGGVLFIDEAYTLSSGGEKDYGQEAIDALLKRMEDDRDDLVVIIAGYNDEIRSFIASNPGLESRFANNFNFKDYTNEELHDIFMQLSTSKGFSLENQAEDEVLLAIENMTNNKGSNFGNGREMRSLFERVVFAQSSRLTSGGEFSKEILTTIEKEDILATQELNHE